MSRFSALERFFEARESSAKAASIAEPVQTNRHSADITAIRVSVFYKPSIKLLSGNFLAPERPRG